MPRNKNEDSQEDSSANSMQTSQQASDQPQAEKGTTRRRRSGRRVVRVAGAAGAHVPVQVEADEHEEAASDKGRRRRVKVQDDGGDTRSESVSRRRSRRNDPEQEPGLSESQASDRDVTEENEEAPTSRRRKVQTRSRRSTRAKTSESTESGSRSRSGAGRDFEDEQDDRQERALEAVESLTGIDSGDDDQDHKSRSTRSRSRSSRSGSSQSAPARPMTSLLFQEPVIPVVQDDDDEPVMEDDEEPAPTRSSRRSRSRRSRNTVDRESLAEDEQRSESGSRRSRRLNAEERRAADEVEQIEEDLDHEGITFINDEDESEEEVTSRSSRRRRRSKGERTHEDEAEKSGSRRNRRSRDHESEEEEEGGLTRRRRRRRGSKSSDSETEETGGTRRSRKQQYIDEITDIEGSTRLEAKKQRRRDNRRERSRQSQLVEQDFLARRESVNRLMVVREKEQHTQISVIEDDILVEHYVSDIQEVSTVGNVYLGRVQNVLPSMEAAFVDIGQARNGVLYAGEVNWDTTRLEGQPRRIELAFKSGDPVLVQVTKDPIGHKGARLTSQVTLAGRFLVLVPSGGMTGVSRKLADHERSRLKGIISRIAPKDMGVIIRTAADGASEEALTKDLENLQRQWEEIESKRKEFLHGKRPKLLQGEPDVAIRVVRDIFNDDFASLVVQGDRVYDRVENYLDTMAPDLRDKLVGWDPSEHEGKDVFDKWGIDSQLRKGMERQVYLPSGGSLVIDRTEAMTTIDVNTGRFIGKGKSLEETVTRCNLEASEEIARQLRLRDIGGMIMIDYVDMVMPANRDLVLRRLVECLARDRTKHQVAEVTSLGLVQMTRKRVGQGLVEAFSEECPTCHGRGFILHDEPTISASYDDPYAVKGGDPFVKTNKHSHNAPAKESTTTGSTPAVKAKLARIAAAAQAAADEDVQDDDEMEATNPLDVDKES